ncbi:MAG: glycosyltransferase [Muribaculaceae bacterium]|nr:glycosyltransferase [Muribaculaceae bacterium]
MKRIAVIFEGDINNRLGVFYAVLNRVQHLRRVANYDIDLHMIQVYDGALMRRVRHSKAVPQRDNVIQVEGETLHVHWVKRDWRDSVLHRLLGKRPVYLTKWLNNLAKSMDNYDLISAHDRMGGFVAQRAAALHQIPHCITWHGASIYTDPPRDPMLKAVTIELLHGATDNFFVSHGLYEKALVLTTGFPAKVLFNGASSDFRRMPDAEREALREKYGVAGRKVVAFVGRFEPVKNVMKLPEIYATIAEKYDGDVAFWTIGTGFQHEQVRQAMAERCVDCHMWGMQPLEQMPLLMNCIDVLVLPSSLEGLPLVTLEALQCGANVVATNVVGTAEGIGRENAVDIDEHFMENFTDRAVAMLQGRVQQQLPPDVSWEATAQKENDIYRKLMSIE